MNAPERPPVLALPPEKRRAIIIVPDGQENARSGSGGAAFIGGVIGALVAGPVGAAIGAGLGIAAGASSPEGIWRICAAEAHNLHLPPGHPQVGEAYGLHPLVNNHYIPLATFHRSVREAKHAELLRLAVALGATRVRAQVAQVASHSNKASVDLQRHEMGGAIQSEHRVSAAHRVAFDESYQPRHAPHVPGGLLWLPHEPTWQGLIERRMQYGTLTATAKLEYINDYGINTALAARVAGIGGTISGGFSDFEAITWDVDITFAALPLATAPVPESGRKAWWKLW